MQYIAAGAAAVAAFVFYKNGAPTTPANAPTITAAYYNGTLLSPLPGIGSPTNPGEYTPTVFTAGQTGTAGYYFAVAYTADTTMDNQISIEEWSVSAVVGSVTGNVGGNVTGSVGSVLGNVAGNVTGSVGSVLGNVAGSVASVVGNVGGNVVGSVGSVLGNVAGSVANLLDISAAALARFFTRDSGSTYGASVPGSVVKEIAANAAIDPEAVADAVWDEPEAEHTTAGTYGAAIPAIQAKTDTIGTAEFTMNAPDLSMASSPIVAGRSYKLVYGNQLSFTISNLGISLLAVNVSVVYNVKVGSSTTAVFTATITGATTGYFQIDSEDTEDWGENRSGYYAEIVVLDAADPINVQIRPLIVLASAG